MNCILVTGGLGFIGSNFLNQFVPKNKDTLIVNIDSETYASSKLSIKNRIEANNH